MKTKTMMEKIRRSKIFIFTLILFFLGTINAHALPQIGEVVSGKVQVERPDEKTLKITASDNAIINYHSFNIAEGESVVITLSSKDSEILNKVLGKEATEILGDLESNGICIIINESGIYIGKNANITAGGLILSTRDIENAKFLAGIRLFKRLSKEQVDMLLTNDGTIRIRKGGFGVLIAGGIENNGIISAPMGKVALAGGDAVRLNMSDDGLISVVIEEATAAAIKDYKGKSITSTLKGNKKAKSKEKSVILKEESLPEIFSKTINLENVTSATEIEVKDGSVELKAADGSVRSTGSTGSTGSAGSVTRKATGGSAGSAELKAGNGSAELKAGNGSAELKAGNGAKPQAFNLTAMKDARL